jgi:transcriptional regulator with XRE-family HTH domain
MNNVFDISNFVDVLTPNSATQTIVERERQRRKKLKISQKQLAERSGVTYASIRRFEATGEISLSSLLKIASALDCLQEFTKLFAPIKVLNLKDIK